MSQVARAGEDAEGDFGEIRLSYEQTWSPEEISDFSSESSKRRRRQIEHDFERRFFTNNPQKAGVLFQAVSSQPCLLPCAHLISGGNSQRLPHAGSGTIELSATSFSQKTSIDLGCLVIDP